MSTSQGSLSQNFLGRVGRKPAFPWYQWLDTGFFPPIFLLSSLCLHLLPAPQASDKELLSGSGQGTAAGAQAPAARDKCSHPRAVGWAGVPHCMGTQRKAAKARKGLKETWVWGVSCKPLRAPRQSGGPAVLGRALCWAGTNMRSGSTNTRILANLPQCQCRFDSDDAVRPLPSSHTALPSALSRSTVPIDPS